MIDRSPPARLVEVAWSELEGWAGDDHQAALACFKVSARRMRERPYTTKLLGTDAAALARVAAAALEQDASGARAFFEASFRPHRIEPLSGQGFVTGYYEPEIAASPVRTERFRFPVYRRPDDLVSIDDSTRPGTMDPSFFFARSTPEGLVEYFDRRQIETGALDGLGLEMFWLESRIDIFFIHVQGSARLVMPDGAIRRISYAAKSGHPFTGIGRVLIDLGEIDRSNVTMQAVRQWLRDRPDRADAIMWHNRSFIFFQEIDHPQPELGPLAAAGVPLTPGRSMAVDHRLHTFGTPFWVSTRQPLPGSTVPFRRIMIGQDTGSAIVGPARGDLFIGTGEEAGLVAGAIKHDAQFHAFLPAMAGDAP